jgi:Cyclin D1 binding domain
MVGMEEISDTSPQINLSGEWIGFYPGHFDEVIRITQMGDAIEAVKITGDDYVPAGNVTWRADLKTLIGEGQIAENGFRNPRYIPGKLTILNSDRIIFSWTDAGEVEFRRDD